MKWPQSNLSKKGFVIAVFLATGASQAGGHSCKHAKEYDCVVSKLPSNSRVQKKDKNVQHSSGLLTVVCSCQPCRCSIIKAEVTMVNLAKGMSLSHHWQKRVFSIFNIFLHWGTRLPHWLI